MRMNGSDEVRHRILPTPTALKAVLLLLEKCLAKMGHTAFEYLTQHRKKSMFREKKE